MHNLGIADRGLYTFTRQNGHLPLKYVVLFYIMRPITASAIKMLTYTLVFQWTVENGRDP